MLDHEGRELSHNQRFAEMLPNWSKQPAPAGGTPAAIVADAIAACLAGGKPFARLVDEENGGRRMVANPQYRNITGVGLQTILAWFGTFWINVLLAQAAFQMALSCRTPEEGRKGLFIAAGFNIIFIVVGIAVGVAAAAVMSTGSGRLGT